MGRKADIRYFSKYKSNGETEGIYKLNGLFLLIFAVIGAVAFACGLFLSFNLTLVFDEGLTAAEYEIARILMLLLTVNLTISFPMTVFTNIISANEKFITLKLVGMLKTVMSPIIHIPVLLLGYGSIGMVVVSVTVLSKKMQYRCFCFLEGNYQNILWVDNSCCFSRSSEPIL